MQSIRLPHRLFRRLSYITLCRTFFLDTELELSSGHVLILGEFGSTAFEGSITRVYKRSVSDLVTDEVVAGGYTNVKQLTHDLAMQYTRFIKEDDLVTIVEFEVFSADNENSGSNSGVQESKKLQGVTLKIAV